MHDADRVKLMTSAADSFQAAVDNELLVAVGEMKRRLMDQVADAYDAGYANGCADTKQSYT